MLSPRSSRLATLALGALVLYLAYRVLAPFLAPIAWAAILAILLARPHRRLAAALRRPGLAALAATAAAILLVVVPVVVLAVVVARQASALAANATAYLSAHSIAAPADLLRSPALAEKVRRLSATLGWDEAQFKAELLAATARVGKWVPGFVSSFALSALGFVGSFFIMAFTLFFFFRDGVGIWHDLRRALPFAPQETDALAQRLESVLQAVFAGTLLTGLLQGALGAVGFLIFGLPSPVVFGALMFVFSLLPVGGTAIVWLPASIVLVASGSVGRGIGLAAWGVAIVGLADNWFKPLIISGRSSLNTLPVFFAVTGGIAAFGFLGLFVGPVAVSLALTLWEAAVARGAAGGAPVANGPPA